jgi:hypothetical protein
MTTSSRPPGPISFSYSPLSESYASRLVRKVALDPLLSTMSAARACRSAEAVSRMWRRRVDRLAEWGIEPAQRRDGAAARPRKWAMINCPSAFALTRPQSRPCRVVKLCPYCRAREALQLWRRVDAFLFGNAWAAGRVSIDTAVAGRASSGRVLDYFDDEDAEAAPARLDGASLIERRIVYRLADAPGVPRPAALLAYRASRGDPVGDGKRHRRGPGRMPGRHGELARFRRLGICGGIDVARVDGLSARDGGDEAGRCGGWKVEFRQVMFCPIDRVGEVTRNRLLTERPPLGRVPCDDPEVRVVELPTRADIRDAVANACRYPRVLMNGGRRVTRLAAEAEAGRHLVTTFGTLYGRSRRSDATDD